MPYQIRAIALSRRDFSFHFSSRAEYESAICCVSDTSFFHLEFVSGCEFARSLFKNLYISQRNISEFFEAFSLPLSSAQRAAVVFFLDYDKANTLEEVLSLLSHNVVFSGSAEEYAVQKFTKTASQSSELSEYLPFLDFKSLASDLMSKGKISEIVFEGQRVVVSA